MESSEIHHATALSQNRLSALGIEEMHAVELGLEADRLAAFPVAPLIRDGADFLAREVGIDMDLRSCRLGHADRRRKPVAIRYGIEMFGPHAIDDLAARFDPGAARQRQMRLARFDRDAGAHRDRL